MLNFNLYTIDWTAIGSMATTIAVISAFISISVSNKQNRKNRKLQILLIRKEQEQKRLDEMVSNILEINHSIKPIDILDFSSKWIDKTFTTEDRCKIDHIAEQDQLNNIRLNIQLIKLKNYPAAKLLLDRLNIIRNIYGSWASNINALHVFLNPDSELPAEQRDVVITNIVDQMVEMCKKTDSQYVLVIDDIYKNRTNIVDIARDIMNIFESEMSHQIQAHKLDFEKELYDFVKKEQERIDCIVEL
ncbi:hypothetical protein SAMN05444349_14140 [Bacteroides faecichinchillae]|uniref:Uncharacterized protein n=1 Tax=Bacteroides faecichinchillae TaxID=871325 RepID=A0A1M5F6L3_9BACE|nr:hypothetical protein [Bacteroides faecichinchillae]SHF87159.1 hypothetical protein SAMN05444349_14140 [Bacteroides faecichinchillae]